jgi:vacuolar-type H+-ATPase subunit E/Vma4
MQWGFTSREKCAYGAGEKCAYGAGGEQVQMETVRTSEVLESQILEDARAKAKRIREAADKECASVSAEWERKDAEETRRLDAARESRIAALRGDLEASLPLDFMRSRLDFFQASVAGALEKLFLSLNAQELGRVIGRQVARASSAFINQRLVVWCSGVSEAEARAIITGSIPGAVVQEVKKLAADSALETGKGLVVETADGSRRFRATMQELSALLLEDHREELVKSLFGKDVLK